MIGRRWKRWQVALYARWHRHAVAAALSEAALVGRQHSGREPVRAVLDGEGCSDARESNCSVVSVTPYAGRQPWGSVRLIGSPGLFTMNTALMTVPANARVLLREMRSVT